MAVPSAKSSVPSSAPEVAIRAVLFDWNGTLVKHASSETFSVASLAIDSYARRNLGVEAAAGSFGRAFSAVVPPYVPGADETCPPVTKFVGEAFTWLSWPAGASDVDACSRLLFAQSTRGTAVYDDARALLGSLAYRGYRVAVVSNTFFPGTYFQAVVSELGLQGHIHSFVSSADVGLLKPNPAPFLRALADLGIEPHDAIFVGDSLQTDIPGARNAGMRAVLLQRSGRTRDRAGFLVIERLSALTGILGEGMAP